MKWILLILIPLLQGCYSSAPINAPGRQRITKPYRPPYSGTVNLFGLHVQAGSQKIDAWRPPWPPWMGIPTYHKKRIVDVELLD
jgi:hypothetical protein